jgi:hypothetical protein
MKIFYAQFLILLIYIKIQESLKLRRLVQKETNNK